MTIRDCIKLFCSAIAAIGIVLQADLPAAWAIDPGRLPSQYRLDTWATKDGLPQGEISSMVQTLDGFVWLATPNGLVRFDGSAFDVYTPANLRGLTAEIITKLYVDRSGRLWVGTEHGGFGVIIAGQYHPRLAPESWSTTLCFNEATDGSMWVGGNGAYKLCRCVDGKVTVCRWLDDAVAGIVELPNGNSLVASRDDGVFEVSPELAKVRAFPELRQSIGVINCICKSVDGSIWCGTAANGLYRIDGGHLTHYSTATGLSSNTITTLYEDRHRKLWVGTDIDIERMDNATGAIFTKARALRDVVVRSISEDEEGNIWIGTGDGLSRLADTKLVPFTLRRGDRILGINRICASADGSVWCATAHGLWRLRSGSTDTYERYPGWPEQEVDGVVEGSGGEVWCWRTTTAQNSTIFRVNPTGNSTASPGINSVVVPNDRCLWAYPDNGAMTVIDRHGDYEIRRGKIVNVHSRDTGFVFATVRDARGSYWLGCDAGLVEVSNGKANLRNEGLRPGTHVLAIDASEPGSLWLATDCGIAHRKNGRSRVYGVHEGLPTNYISGILRDGKGHIWVNSAKGILRIDQADIDHVDAKTAKSIQCVVYGTGDGVQVGSAIAGQCATTDGKLWFNNATGLTMVDPQRITTNSVRPRVVIERAILDGVSMASNAETTLPPGPGNLEIRYAGLSFMAPEGVRFRYKLDGYQSTWTDAGQSRTATLTNLPPGHYRFQVIARNNDGVWNKTGASIWFYLTPHYYQTVWFRVLMVCLSIYAVLIVIRIRSIHLVRHAQILSAKVKQRTAELEVAVDNLNNVMRELESQNNELVVVKEELDYRNRELEQMQCELEAQNDELVETHATLAETNAYLADLATIDGLTGVKNHRAFQEHLDTEWQRRARTTAPLSVILFDVDHFKQYNDAYGHPGGDEVLRTIGRLLNQFARDSDLVARYGGEEFAVIAADTDVEGAVALAERLRAAIEDAKWPHRAVTASFGVSTSSLSTQQPQELIAAADSALYRSKALGRNQVTHSRTLIDVPVSQLES